MMRKPAVVRAVFRGRFPGTQLLHTCRPRCKDARLRSIGKEIYNDYAQLRESYDTPKHPIVLAHGLFGFSELRLAAGIPAIQYWHGIKDALQASGASVLVTSVSPSSSIATRAAELADGIVAEQRRKRKQQATAEAIAREKTCDPPDGAAPSPPEPQAVNIVAHSMGGLDARYLISRLRSSPATSRALRVASLTTIATPHRGSPVADLFADDPVAGPSANPLRRHLPRLYGMLLPRLGLGTAEALAQLTTRHMVETFNPATPDDPDVRYFSYGADMGAPPPLFGVFRKPYLVVRECEGPNDGFVSVQSSRWGEYQGTLMSVSHLDLINWSNRMRWAMREMMGMKRNFNAVAFYLGIADMLAKQGL